MTDYVPISKQDLLTCGLNVFGLDLAVESFLKSSGLPEEIHIFYPVNRSDCADFTGVNISLKSVRKTKENEK